MQKNIKFGYGRICVSQLALLGSGLLFGAVEGYGQSEDAFVLEEITVTARKREESLQSTPIAVSALSTADLRI